MIYNTNKLLAWCSYKNKSKYNYNDIQIRRKMCFIALFFAIIYDRKSI